MPWLLRLYLVNMDLFPIFFPLVFRTWTAGRVPLRQEVILQFPKIQEGQSSLIDCRAKQILSNVPYWQSLNMIGKGVCRNWSWRSINSCINGVTKVGLSTACKISGLMWASYSWMSEAVPGINETSWSLIWRRNSLVTDVVIPLESFTVK